MKLPQHIAIVMDGNGRWAEKRNLPRIMGHRAGVKTVRAITEACAKLGIKVLTLYTLSTENWKRPKNEIEALMSLLEGSLIEYREELLKNNIRLKVIGQVDSLAASLREKLEKVVKETSSNTGMILALALNYGGRQEIINAAKAAAKKFNSLGKDIALLDEKAFGCFLYTEGLPDPDIVIRTSGEMRLSNFLIWQTAYSEFYVTDTLWPDFTGKDLKKALDEFGKRNRRFGG